MDPRMRLYPQVILGPILPERPPHNSSARRQNQTLEEHERLEVGHYYPFCLSLLMSVLVQAAVGLGNARNRGVTEEE